MTSFLSRFVGIYFLFIVFLLFFSFFRCTIFIFKLFITVLFQSFQTTFKLKTIFNHLFFDQSFIILIHPTTPQSTQPPLNPPNHPSIHPTTPQSTQPPLNPPNHPSIHPTTPQSTQPFIHPSYYSPNLFSFLPQYAGNTTTPSCRTPA